MTVVAGVGLGTAAPASAADSATVWASWNSAIYTAGVGQENNLAVTQVAAGNGSDKYYVFNDSVPISPGENCFHPYETDPTVVNCLIQGVGDIPSVHVDVGDSDDNVVVRTTGIAIVYAEDGDDSVNLSGVFHEADGGAGHDTLAGGFVLRGGLGNDTLRPILEGEAYGDEGNDTIIGNSEDERLYGGPGNDVVYGQEGDDLIHGDAGDDELHGGTGNDEIHGDAGDDLIFGNSGDDRLYGGAGVDEISGGPGNNVIRQD
ncbi:calcium-binding protein [Streptomyces mayteni]